LALSTESSRGDAVEIFGLSKDENWASVAGSADPAVLFVEAIRRRSYQIESPRVLDATRLVLRVDTGGSTGNGSGLWKVELAKLANKIVHAVTVCSFSLARANGNGLSTRCSASSQ